MAVPVEAGGQQNDYGQEIKLFEQVFFHIVLSSSLLKERAEQLASVLTEHGAVRCEPSASHGNIEMEHVTHFITTTIDFEGYEAAELQMKAVVTPLWVDQSVLRNKIGNPRQYSPDPRMFFSGLVVAVAGLPDGDKDAIIGGLTAMGGLYSPQISKLVTHIVALNEQNQHCQIARNKNLNCKIVLPHWFDACLRLGQRISEGPYQLPNPPILIKSSTDRILPAARPDLEGALSVVPQGPLTPFASSDHDSQTPSIFSGKKVMLSSDLAISDHLLSTIEDLIRRGGGQVVQTWNECDTLVCQYRDGEDYKNASSNGKTVGNLSWLYYTMSRNAWTSPLRRLLHYPIARGGLPGFKDFRISLSNYNGEARIYLENLAKAAGCEFTKTMKMENTHLITAHLFSEKCDAAREWNINIVNHLWLEESYANWQVMNLTDSRYVQFPARTNLSEVVGQTQISRKALERYFYPKLNLSAQVSPIKPKDKPAQLPTTEEIDAAVTGMSKTTIAKTPKAAKPKPRVNGHNAQVTPLPAGTVSLGKENETPSTGSRSAKDKANAKLHELAPDIALYEKERKRVGGVIHGGKRNPDDRVSIDISRKRSISAEDEDESGESDAEISDGGRAAKRARKARSTVTSRLLVTGFKWEEKKLWEAKTRLRDIGVLLTENYDNCDYLAAPKMLRTQKFICAVARAPTVVSMEFVFDSVTKKELQDPKKYPLKDPENEKKYGIRLEEILRRAKANSGKLLQGKAIYTTEKIQPGFDTLKSVVESSGGRLLLYRGRAGAISANHPPGKDTDDENSEEDNEPQQVYLVSGTSSEEVRLWPKFRSAAESAGRIPRIVGTVWLLDVTFKQQLEWRPDYELSTKES